MLIERKQFSFYLLKKINLRDIHFLSQRFFLADSILEESFSFWEFVILMKGQSICFGSWSWKWKHITAIFLIPFAMWWIEKILVRRKKRNCKWEMDNLFTVKLIYKTGREMVGSKEARGEEGTKSRDYQWKCWRETRDTWGLPCSIMWWHKQPRAALPYSTTVQLSVLTIRDVAIHFWKKLF